MRILHITPAFQHPQVRGSNRHYHFLRELSQRHAITLLTLERSPIAPEAMQEVSAYTEQLYTFQANGAAGKVARHMPLIGRQAAQLLGLRAGVQQMKVRFARLIQEEAYDLVLFHGKDCFPVIEKRHGLPMVADVCDATSFRVRTRMEHVHPALALLLRLRYLQVRRVEQKLVQSTPHLAFISERDRAAVLGANGQAKVIPNGIDLDYWTRRSHTPRPNCLIFTGVMSYGPNEDAALFLIDHILPLLASLVPDLRIIIAGREPSPALRQRAQQHPQVEVTGYVEDMRDHLEKAALFVAPLRYGAGMQNKIQEALAMEIPVITTPIVADGLRMANGAAPPVYVAEGAQAFAAAITSLLGQEGERRRLAQAGRRFAGQYFDWRRSAAQLEELCLEAVMATKRKEQSKVLAAAV
jgi:glycosyltransferase involved in cell wall biosynthesis